MSANFAAKLLNQLMGPNRNALPKSEKFVKGDCHLNHAEVLKEDYEKSDEFGSKGYELDLIDDIKRILSDCDRKIERAKEKIIANRAKSKEALEKAEIERQSFLDTKIEHLLAKIEALGSQGRVEEAQEVADVIEKLKQDKSKPIDTPSAPISNYLLEKDMEVCSTCGAFILIGDLQTRIEDHIIGKQHAGYQKLRDTVEELKQTDWEGKYRMAKKALRDKKDRSGKDRDVNKSRKSRHRSSDDSKDRSSRVSDRKSSKRDYEDERKSHRKSKDDSSKRSSKRDRSRDDSSKHSKHRDEVQSRNGADDYDQHQSKEIEERKSRKRRDIRDSDNDQLLEKSSSKSNKYDSNNVSKKIEKDEKTVSLKHSISRQQVSEEGEISDDDD